MKSFQNIVHIVTAFRYYFGINVIMHKNTMKCIIIILYNILNEIKIMLIKYEKLKCNRDMNLYILYIYIYTVYNCLLILKHHRTPLVLL